MNDVLKNYKRDHLNRKKKGNSNSDTPLVMVTKYNPAMDNIKKKLLKYWHTLSREPKLKEIFKDKPIITIIGLLSHRRNTKLVSDLSENGVRGLMGVTFLQQINASCK